MIKKLLVYIILASVLLAACSPAARATSAPLSSDSFAGPAPASPSTGKTTLNENSPGSGGATSPGGTQDQAIERIVIRNADLTIVVDDPAHAMDAISKMAADMGGYIVSSNLYKTTTENNQEVPQAKITVRVPAPKLNDALGIVKGLTKDQSKDVLVENVTGQDVTSQYTDLQSRVANLEESEAQLKEIMKSAQKTEDVLAIQNQLSQTREQIEVLKGQIQYYKESSQLSSIAVDIQAQAAVQPLEIGGWQPVGVARNAVQTLINTLQVFANIGIWLVIYVLPIALVIFIPLRILWWLLRRGSKNRKTPTAPIIPPSV